MDTGEDVNSQMPLAFRMQPNLQERMMFIHTATDELVELHTAHSNNEMENNLAVESTAHIDSFRESKRAEWIMDTGEDVNSQMPLAFRMQPNLQREDVILAS
ncbi:hypothetical protein CCACVL1_29997 [Corchorus capsularis]|uniref:Uncharacterized protein n=1 Tax=Corchorus capsularis TaxID=210143 RepID=A0A1R3FZ64_COCAP|nr:hypothetical protein CCACVL1_29997 [Corchorus capsularis]